MGCLGFIAATLSGDVISDPLPNTRARVQTYTRTHTRMVTSINQLLVVRRDTNALVKLKWKTFNLYGLLLLSHVGRALDVDYFYNNSQNANKKNI